ncbi:MAG: hypothetical protein JW941_12570 [Candidatus Coatesbacteria bacterium]|nr:hypothetical protein [Candidatus Coatesbacteria bacterium]
MSAQGLNRRAPPLDKLDLAVRYEGSKDFNPAEMPEHQYGGAIGYSFTEYSSVALEYLRGEFKDDDIRARNLVTLQLALEF